MACPLCDPDGAFYVGTPLTQCRHFISRALWDLHRSRQSLQTLGRMDLADIVSTIIRQLDPVASELAEH